MADKIVVFWRDIPAQVIVKQGRKSAKRELSLRFTEAIDMCAMRTGAAETDDYLAEWRKAEDWRRERWVQKYNHRWSAILDAWVELLTHAQGPRGSAYGLAQEAGVDAMFELGAKTARSRPAHDHDFFHVQRGQR